MSDRPPPPTDPRADETLARLRWPVRLTRAGLLAERLTQNFWKVWSIVFVLVAAGAFRIQDQLPLEIAWAGLVLGLGGIAWGLWSGIRRFRWPTRAEALERLDATLPGRPLAALRDRQAIGAGDAGSSEVWAAHRARMAARASTARPPRPDLRLSRRDPYALRYLALLVLLLAAGFGSIWQITGPGPLPGTGGAVAAGPAWEGWVQPPAYTGKPSFYLNDVKAAGFDAPKGSKVTLRLYGKVGALTVAEGVSGRTGDVGSASAADQAFDIAQSGKLSINGPGGRAWDVSVTADAPPRVSITAPPERKASGEMELPFHAGDDYGVVKGHATIALDIGKVDRRYGLAVPPEAIKPVVFDLPMPVNGKRTDFTGMLRDDLQKSVLANLPVTITLTVADAAGQSGNSAPMQTVLPGRRFFDPLAAAVIEMRRDLLWSAANADRADQILRAITWKPDGFIKNQKAYLMLRVAMQRLEGGIAAGLTPAVRDEVAEALWQVAVALESGTLSDALDRLKAAQDKLSEAIRRGASKDEIAKLMDEMQKALQNYVAKLAEQQQPGNQQDQRLSEMLQGPTISGDQMQQMLDRLQQLMQEGKMAEAQQLLDRLRQLTQNMRVVQGQGGMQVPGGKAMQGLSDTLRQQQQLSDNTFQDLQNRFSQQKGQNGQQGQQGQGQQGQGRQGQPGQQGQGGQNGQAGAGQGQQQGQGDGGGTGLAERQQQLRRQLRQQAQGGLPGDGTQDGQDARGALDRAGRAMDQAEQALRQGDNSRALDNQAQAMDALRQGLHAMDQAMAKQQGQATGQVGEAQGQTGPKGQQSDPLGREVGSIGSMGSAQDMLQGEDVYRRARELLNELRKRSGEADRPTYERDYLKRLLNFF